VDRFNRLYAATTGVRAVLRWEPAAASDPNAA